MKNKYIYKFTRMAKIKEKDYICCDPDFSEEYFMCAVANLNANIISEKEFKFCHKEFYRFAPDNAPVILREKRLLSPTVNIKN